MKKLIRIIIYTIVGIYVSLTLSGCSGTNGLISITPEQYLTSAKEQFETIDERDYEVRDLDEIIRILENAEKNAKKSETIDRARMYLCLVNTIKARKQYRTALMKGEYIANRPEPFYTINTKEVKETLRTAKKWLRLTNSTFKTNKILADLNYVKGIYYTQKMLTQQARERQESLNEAIECFRRCLGIAPDYKGEFKLFGMAQTAREVKLKLIECLSEGGMAADAYSILSEFSFAPVIPISGANEKFDYQWNHMKGLVLACMGMYEESAEILSKFKVVSPVDYAMVDESIWLLEGVRVPEWRDYAPTAFVNVKEQNKIMKKINVDATYWYERKVEFEKNLEECKTKDEPDERFACYEQLKQQQYEKISGGITSFC